MLTDVNVRLPHHYSRILNASLEISFGMNSDVLTGNLLRALVASKPDGTVLELGTGCGLGTCWLLDGMTSHASLVSVDNDPTAQAVARRVLGDDRRASFVLADGGEYLVSVHQRFDVIYADAWPGKYSHLADALGLLARGGLYVIDDMLPQPNWPAGHQDNVTALMTSLTGRDDIEIAPMSWSTGVVLCIKR